MVPSWSLKVVAKLEVVCEVDAVKLRSSPLIWELDVEEANEVVRSRSLMLLLPREPRNEGL